MCSFSQIILSMVGEVFVRHSIQLLTTSKIFHCEENNLQGIILYYQLVMQSNISPRVSKENSRRLPLCGSCNSIVIGIDYE